MKEDYSVIVRLTAETSGGQPLVCDSKINVEFDATDIHRDRLVEKFEDFMRAMGYGLENMRLELVEGRR